MRPEREELAIRELFRLQAARRDLVVALDAARRTMKPDEQAVRRAIRQFGRLAALNARAGAALRDRPR